MVESMQHVIRIYVFCLRTARYCYKDTLAASEWIFLAQTIYGSIDSTLINRVGLVHGCP